MALNGRMHGSLSPPERELHNFRAITTVGDRSFLTELLVLVLAVTFAFPSSACGSTAKESTAVSARGQTRPVSGHATNVLPQVKQPPVLDRHLSKLRGVLDDDPAILDDSEDWVEGPTGFAPQYPDFPAPVLLRASDQRVGTMACPPHTHARLIQLLCTYQC